MGESAVMEWMNAMSSTHVARWGKRSEMCFPHFPWGWNRHLGPTMRPSFLWPPRPKVLSAIVFPSSPSEADWDVPAYQRRNNG